jgi:hypothetical protein
MLTYSFAFSIRWGHSVILAAEGPNDGSSYLIFFRLLLSRSLFALIERWLLTEHDSLFRYVGLVSVESAKWGTYMGTLEGVNHL